MAAPTTGNDYARCEPGLTDYGLNQRQVCTVHGGFVMEAISGVWQCQTVHVLLDVKAERARQFAAYGTNEVLEDGTGPDVQWLLPLSIEGADHIEDSLRVDYEAYKAVNEPSHLPTWMHLVREELAEAFKEQDPENLRAELIQAAALCVSWVEKIDARRVS